MERKKKRKTVEGRRVDERKAKKSRFARRSERQRERRDCWLIGVSYPPVGKLQSSLPILPSFSSSSSSAARLLSLFPRSTERRRASDSFVDAFCIINYEQACETVRVYGLPIIIIPPIIMSVSCSIRLATIHARVRTYVATRVKMYESMRRFMNRRSTAS